MIKRLVLEGVDNVGKSTVAKMLKDRLSYKDYGFDSIEIVHFTGPPKGTSQLKNFLTQLSRIKRLVNEPGNHLVITDRDIYGEMVYGPLYRDENPNWIWDLENYYFSLTEESLFILLEDTAKNSLSREDGLSLTTDRFKRYREILKFRKALKTSKIPHKHTIKITDKTPEVVVRKVLQHFFNAIPMEEK